MIIKRKTVKEYTNDSDLIELCESIWGDYIRDMDEDVLTNLIGAIVKTIVDDINHNGLEIDAEELSEGEKTLYAEDE